MEKSVNLESNLWCSQFFQKTSETIKSIFARAVGRSENSGVPVLFSGHNLPLLIERGLTDLPKFKGAMAPPAPPGTTPLFAKEKKLRISSEFRSFLEDFRSNTIFFFQDLLTFTV